jgi:hypothetical protein
MKTIFGFYAPILNTDQAEQFSRANYWKHSWERNGWHASMLNRTHAQASPYYTKLQRKIMESSNGTPLQHGVERDKLSAKYSRWCALHSARGGWLSHYDVLNMGFSVVDAESKEKESQIHVTEGAPYLIYASHSFVAQALERILAEPLFNDGEIRNEFELFGLKSSIDSLPVIHVKETDSSRSEEMRKLCSPSENDCNSESEQ